MTTKAKTATSATAADEAEAAQEKPTVAPQRRKGDCVIDDGTAHMGRAVNGLVCSAHAMHYRADGSRRR